MKARYIQRGESIDFVPTADVAAGDILKLGKLIGIAKLDIKTGELGSLALVGVYEIPKVGLAEFAQGALVAYDFENGFATTAETSPESVPIGHAVAAAGRSDTTVLVRIEQGLA